MKTRFLLSAIVIGVALAAAAVAQDAGTPVPTGGNGGGYGQRDGRGGFGGGPLGRGLMGTVTGVAADHYTIKTDAGDVYVVHFSANTRIVKQGAQVHRPGGGSGGQDAGGGNPPQQIKASDIKVGDVIGVMGEIDATAKSVGAAAIAEVDPERVQQMRAMEANFGKTWLQGKVTAINETTITLTGTLDNVPHTVAADENTAFRKHREPVTLAEIQLGDTIRADGAVRNGVFIATGINVGGARGDETPAVPRSAPPQ